MLNFNLWTWNSRVFPGIDTLVVRRNDRVRVRIANLTMTNHPIHIHGHNFRVTLTDGGWVPRTAQWPETTVDMPVGSMRAFEFVADNPGDWAFHCHKSHHVMNAMGHDVPTMIGVDHRGVAERINKLIPDYMLMGERGMADMGEMEMPLPDNTLPMMSGQGPFGALEMGGMFTVVKCATASRATTTRIRAGTSTRPARWRTNGRARRRARSASHLPSPPRTNSRLANRPATSATDAL